MAAATIFCNVRYRIKRPDVKKLAFVKRGANGQTWFLFKGAPSSSPPARDIEPQDDFVQLIKSLPADDAEKVIDGLVASLSREEAEELVSYIDRWENPPWRAELEARVAEAERAAAARHARTALAKADGPEVAAQREMAALAEQAERARLRDRFARSNAERREEPRNAMSYIYSRPTASPDEGADMVMRLRAADPKANRPHWRGAF